MSNKKKCSCGKHKSEHHEEMTQSELITHVKDCLKDAIHKLECIQEVLDKVAIE
jgi:hypothetical protein